MENLISVRRTLPSPVNSFDRFHSIRSTGASSVLAVRAAQSIFFSVKMENVIYSPTRLSKQATNPRRTTRSAHHPHRPHFESVFDLPLPFRMLQAFSCDIGTFAALFCPTLSPPKTLPCPPTILLNRTGASTMREGRTSAMLQLTFCSQNRDILFLLFAWDIVIFDRLHAHISRVTEIILSVVFCVLCFVFVFCVSCCVSCCVLFVCCVFLCLLVCHLLCFGVL